MHFVYDFDSTLFKLSTHWDAWKTVLLGFDLTEEEIVDAVAKVIPVGFTLTGHGEELGLAGKEFDKAVKNFRKITKETAPSLVFDDVIPFLEEHANDHKQSILTFGDHEHQHAKIQATKLSELIDDIRIARPDNTKAMQLREMVESGSDQIVFIDDSIKELLSVYEAGLPITLMRMMREGEHHTEEEHEHDNEHWTCIQSLNDIHEHL